MKVLCWHDMETDGYEVNVYEEHEVFSDVIMLSSTGKCI